MDITNTDAEVIEELYYAITQPLAHPFHKTLMKQAADRLSLRNEALELSKRPHDSKIAGEVESLLNDLDLANIDELRQHVSGLEAEVARLGQNVSERFYR